MITPTAMLTTKNKVREHATFFLIVLGSIGLFAGCMPAGPRAVVKGERFLEEGEYPRAIEELEKATRLLRTNGAAWNSLGLAYQYSGQPAKAVEAYKLALKYEPGLSETHYNLGCLWLAQDKLDVAKSSFMTYALASGNPEGYVMRGLAEFRTAGHLQGPARLRELDAADADLKEGLKRSPNSAEALNLRGLIRVQRQQLPEALSLFKEALKQTPDYSPALLNLAIVQDSLHNRPAALEAYRAFLAKEPAAPEAEAVKAALRRLEQENAPPAKPSQPPVPTNPPVSKPPSPQKGAPAKVPGPVLTNQPPVPTNTSPPTPPRKAAPVKPTVSGVTNPPPVKPTVVTNTAPSFSRPEPLPQDIPRYTYRHPAKPASGNRAEAEGAFKQGVAAHQGRRLSEAAHHYDVATLLDPAYFDAYFNWGLLAASSGEYATALTQFEKAIALRPESADARFNFALTLDRAGYSVDAANELDKLLGTSPSEARAHLALANLCARKLRQPGRARQHYLAALQSDPKNPQAESIRAWLKANP
jgi:tetratricopeptide (TPR) repeat protein